MNRLKGTHLFVKVEEEVTKFYKRGSGGEDGPITSAVNAAFKAISVEVGPSVFLC